MQAPFRLKGGTAPWPLMDAPLLYRISVCPYFVTLHY